MTDTDRMVVWLREAMDAAERDAKEATPGPWVVRGLGRHDQAAIVQDSGARNAMSLPIGPAFMDAQGSRATADARHAARHDPAAVLRRITADRKILAAHPYTTRVINPKCGQQSAGFGCENCHNWDGVPEGRGNCATVLALAEGWGWTEETT